MKCCHRCQPLLNMMDKLYDTRWMQWRGVARKYGHQESDMDVVHDALSYLWIRRHDFEYSSIEQTDLLIKRLIRFTALKKVRKIDPNRKYVEMPLHLPSNYRADDSDYYLYGRQLMKILKSHKPFLLKYFTLRYFDLLSDEEIQERFNLASKCSAKARFSDIKRILRHELAIE